jgi:hypothetical protein
LPTSGVQDATTTRIGGGVVVAYKSREIYKADMANARLIRDVDEGRRELAILQARLTATRNEANEKHFEMQALEQERSENMARMEAAQNDMSLAAAERLTRIAKMKTAMDLSEKAFAAERKKIQAIDEQLSRDENHAVDMEVTLQKKIEMLDAALVADTAKIQRQRGLAEARAAAEVRSADNVTRSILHRELEKERKEADMIVSGQQTINTTADLSASARERLRENQGASAAIVAASKRATQDTLIGRANSVLSLKAHIDHSTSEMKSANARRQAAAHRKTLAQQDEYDSLLEQGYNPYEVWRARERDEKVKRLVIEHEEAVAASRLKVTEKVVNEDFKMRYLESEKREEDNLAEEYKRSISRTVRQASQTAYIVDKTKTHEDTIDPSGKLFRVEPSSVTVLRPSGFGLGKVGLKRPDIIAKVASKPENLGVGPLAHWIPKELEPDGDNNDNEEIDEEEDEAIHAAVVEEIDDFGETIIQRPKKKYVLREQTVYEKRLMAKARQRQKSNITQKQVVLGKEYKGVGFLPAPAILHFKDFTVGEPFEIKFTLTNVSLTFNSFKVLPLPDEIRDLFTITFVPPGRMSAGMTIPCKIIFLPRQNVDIRNNLQLLAQTGLVSIPLLCTTKKALPLIRQPVLDLGEVVLGEKKSGFFVIENEGALPLQCVVTRASLFGEGSMSSGGELSDDSGGESPGSGDENGFRREKSIVRQPAPAMIDDDGLADALSVQERVDLPGYGTVKINAEFAPKNTGVVHLPLELSFFNPPAAAVYNGEVGVAAAAIAAAAALALPTPSNAPNMSLLCKAAGIDVPLYVETDVLDMKTCLTGKLYRGTLVVFNRGSIALRCSPNVHPGLARGPSFAGGNVNVEVSITSDLDTSRQSGSTTLIGGGGGVQSHKKNEHIEPSLSFHPTTGFVQAADPITGAPGRFEFAIKFRPTSDLVDRPELQDCRVYENGDAVNLSSDSLTLANEDSMDGTPVDDTSLALAPCIEVPMLIWAPDQVLPVPFSFRARISSPDLAFEPNNFDFGTCYLGQAVSLPITIFNRSALPQKFGFVRLPSCFSVDPSGGGGFGLLLPGESCQATVTFSPWASDTYQSKLQCRTTTNGRFFLDVKGSGMRAPLTISHPVLFMAATAVDEEEVSYVHLSNNFDYPIDFEVLQPQSSGPNRESPLSVLPSVGRLQGRETCRLIVKHLPRQSDLDFGLASLASSPGALLKARLAMENGRDIENLLSSPGQSPTRNTTSNSASSDSLNEISPPSVINTWQLPIFTRPIPPHSLLSADMDNGLGLSSKAATAIKAKLEAEKAMITSRTLDFSHVPPMQAGVIMQVTAAIIPRILSANRRKIDFGQVPVGYNHQEIVRITNHSDVPLELVLSPFAAAVAFHLSNAPRTLAASTYHDLVITFKPTGHRTYSDRLIVGSKEHGPTIDIIMSGVGVSPQVVIEPAGSNIVDFGSVCSRDACSRTLLLHNISAFPLSFTARQIQSTPALWAPTPVLPFYIDPVEGTVPAQGKMKLTVTFTPRHALSAGIVQNAAFEIDIPNQDKDAVQTIYLSGRCFDRAGYVLPAIASEEIQKDSPSAVDSAVCVGRNDEVSDAEGQEIIKLIFPSSALSTTNKTNIDRPHTAHLSQTHSSNGPEIKDLIVSCINRSEHQGMAAGTHQPASTFTVSMPPYIMRRGLGSKERPHFFSVSPKEGSVAPGSTQTVSFKFDPPAGDHHHHHHHQDGNDRIPGPLSVGEWQELDCLLTITGGYVVDGALPTKTILVRLRGYVSPSSIGRS